MGQSATFASMEFGKLPDIINVDFALPPDPPGNLDVLKKTGNTPGQPHLYIGATGWVMKEWVAHFYPKGTKPKDYLRHYAAQFNTIELNTTHYGIPDEATIRNWYEGSAPDFRFCPKILQRISHSRELSPGGPLDLTRQFCEAMAGLKEKLGPCFLQLPPYFGPERLPVLAAFLEKWNRHGLSLAVEARHEGWFADPVAFNHFFDLLENYGAFPVITDVAGRRDVCHARLTGDTLLIRFVGNGLHPTDFTRIDEWSGRLKSWFENGLRNVFFFTHEPDNVLTPVLAKYLHEKMKGFGNVATRGPVPLANEATDQQMALF